MFVVKGLWSEDKKVTYLYTQANEAKDALSSAAADMVYDVSAIARVDYVRVFRADEDDVNNQWYNVTIRHIQLPEQDKTGQTTKPTTKTRQALVQASDTIEAAAMVQGDEELRCDEVVKIACAKYDEVK